MIEFVECPLLRKRITLDRCRLCPENHHRGIRLNLTVETIEAHGGVGGVTRTQINEQDLPAFKLSHPQGRYQVTSSERFLLCLYPRRMPIEVVEG